MATRMYVCESSEHPSIMLSGLNEQRLKGILCDITVRVQGHLFKAHINVLSATMGYFRDLFVKTGKDKLETTIEIPIIVNATGFAKILDFVYTSQLCLSQSTVMQVLCSACYLQIPYVVEKCQEFIVTHGHVTSQASLSEVTVPLLQNLQQQKNFSSSLANQNASASLSLLSQLNRMNQRTKLGPPLQTQSNASPQAIQDHEEQQECALINTPPSPNTNNDEESAVVTTANENCEKSLITINVMSLNREKDTDMSSNDVKPPSSVYSPQSYSLPQEKVTEGPTAKKFIYSNSRNQPLDLATNSFLSDRDVIDHKSLAEYFSTDRDGEYPKVSSSGPVPFQFDQLRNGYAGSMNHIALTSRKVAKDRVFENGSSTQTFTIKKDKPKKEYKCEYCDKMFGRQQHLKRHILTHTGERPYPCTYCDKRFRRSEHLKHHLASHVGNANGENTNSRSTKKQKKPTRVDDAYSLSKMMLNQYGQTNQGLAENGLVSAPVVLPSMFTDGDRLAENSSDQQQTSGSPHLESNGIENKGNEGVVGNEQENDDAALNLCTMSPKEENLEALNSISQVRGDESNELVNHEGNDDETTADQNSTMSESRMSPENDINGLFDENPSPGLLGMEGSEVLTPDLKRLMAALNK